MKFEPRSQVGREPTNAGPRGHDVRLGSVTTETSGRRDYVRRRGPGAAVLAHPADRSPHGTACVGSLFLHDSVNHRSTGRECDHPCDPLWVLVVSLGVGDSEYKGICVEPGLMPHGASGCRCNRAACLSRVDSFGAKQPVTPYNNSRKRGRDSNTSSNPTGATGIPPRASDSRGGRMGG